MAKQMPKGKAKVCVATTQEVASTVEQAMLGGLKFEATRTTAVIEVMGEEIYRALKKNAHEDNWIVRYNPKHFAKEEVS